MIRKTGIIISIALGLILAAAAVCVSISLIFPEIDGKVIQRISDNWLIIIFKSHAKFINTSTNPLHGISCYDIFILILFTCICTSLFITLGKKYKIWFMIAISLVIAGVIIFLITQLAGRSAFMASGLIISIILMSEATQSNVAGITGIISNTLLLLGDFTVGTTFKIIPVLFGLGYILEIIWIFMIAFILIRAKIQEEPTVF
jgi:hypothetical protein